MKMRSRSLCSTAGSPLNIRRSFRFISEQEHVGLHRIDLIIERQLIVELKAIKDLEDIHFAQLRSYLRATGLPVGLLMNFNAPRLVIKRVVN